MPITETPLQNLDPTPLIFGKSGEVLLQYQQDIPPVLLVEVISEDVPGPRRSWAPGKGSGALVYALWETNAEYL